MKAEGAKGSPPRPKLALRCPAEGLRSTAVAFDFRLLIADCGTNCQLLAFGCHATMRRAFADLNGKSTRLGSGVPTFWMWALPEDVAAK